MKLEGHTDDDLARLREVIASPHPSDWAGLVYSCGVLLERVAELEAELEADQFAYDRRMAAQREKIRRLRQIERRAAKHAVAAATVIAGLMRRLGLDEAMLEDDELAAIDHVVDLDVARGSDGDYEHLLVRVEPRESEG